MSRKTRTHLRGKRGQAFADQIRGIPSEQILCVSLVISKYYHVVMIHNALGDIVTPIFEQCNGCAFGCQGWAPRPLVIKVSIASIGNQGGHGAHSQPKRALCPLAAGGGKWHDAILCGWPGPSI